jgi:protein translocase SecG subunit
MKLRLGRLGFAAVFQTSRPRQRGGARSDFGTKRRDAATSKSRREWPLGRRALQETQSERNRCSKRLLKSDPTGTIAKTAVQIAYQIFLVLGVIAAIAFAVLVFITGKGDAMSGGGSVRTTFKGKASIEDLISRMTLGLGIAFMVFMIVLDVMGTQLYNKGGIPK